MSKSYSDVNMEALINAPANDTILDHIANIMEDPISRGQFSFLLQFYQVRALTRMAKSLQHLEPISDKQTRVDRGNHACGSHGKE